MYQLIIDIFQPKQSYAFSYKVFDHLTGDDHSHKQSQEGQATKGEYRVKLPDGRTQIVSYKADKNGYNAEVTYAEEEVETVPKLNNFVNAEDTEEVTDDGRRNLASSGSIDELLKSLNIGQYAVGQLSPLHKTNYVNGYGLNGFGNEVNPTPGSLVDGESVNYVNVPLSFPSKDVGLVEVAVTPRYY